jgi:hypothetical protein
MDRRMFLRSAGATGVVFGAAVIWRIENSHVLSPCSGPAYEPWAEWRKLSGSPIEQLVRAAILAANPHNSQPWMFHLGDGSIDVYADTSRRIGVIDPLLREMHIGIGCAVENLLLAAEHSGYTWKLDDAPPVNSVSLHPVLRVVLKQATIRTSDLYDAIPKRHTNRGRYVSAKEIDGRFFQALAEVSNCNSQMRVFWFRKPEEKRAFGELVVSATEAIIADTEQSKSSAQWMRASWSEIQHHRDGLTYDAQVLDPEKRALAKLLPALSVQQADRYWLTQTRNSQVATANTLGLIAVRDFRNVHSLTEAGRLWQRMQLLATAFGVAMQPLNQPLERRDRELQLGLPPTYAKALAELQQDDSWHAVMPFRLGYPEHAALPSPRRSIESVLL